MQATMAPVSECLCESLEAAGYEQFVKLAFHPGK